MTQEHLWFLTMSRSVSGNPLNSDALGITPGYPQLKSKDNGWMDNDWLRVPIN